MAKRLNAFAGHAPIGFSSHALVCELQSSVRERSGIASQHRHIDRIRPAICHTVVHVAVAGKSHEASAALLDHHCLPASRRVVLCPVVYSNPFLLHRCDRPPLERLVGGMDEIRLPRCRDTGAKENPRVGAPDQVWTTLDVCVHAQHTEFMTAQCYEEAIPCRFPGSEDPHRFQPTCQSATLLAHGLPPGAAWCHENEWSKLRVASRDLGCNVERLRRIPLYLRDKDCLRSALDLRLQPLAFCP